MIAWVDLFESERGGSGLQFKMYIMNDFEDISGKFGN
jgi:hypothetical protein